MWLLVTVVTFLICTTKAGWTSYFVRPYIEEFEIEINGVKTHTTYNPVNRNEGYYNFFDGEWLNINCRKSKNLNEVSFGLSYTTKGTSTIQTGMVFEGPISMDIKLRAEDAESYVDCKPVGYQQTATRLYFLLQTHNNAAIGFQVNGLTLTPIKGYDENLFFNYYYYAGEQLEINSFKDEILYGELHCNLKGSDTTYSMEHIDLNFSFLDYKTLFLSCIVPKYNTRSNKYKNISINLQLAPDIVDFSRPFIRGLSTAHMLRRYRKTDLTDIIVYEYDDTKTKDLTLKCFSHNAIPEWEYEPKEVENIIINSSRHQFIGGPIYNVKTGTFKLSCNQNTSIVICNSAEDSGNREIRVTLIRKKKCVENSPEIITRSPTDVLIVFAAIMAVASIVTLWAVVHRKRKKNTQNLGQMRNETSPKQNEEYPISSQGSEVYATPVYTIEKDFYSMPYTATTADVAAKPVLKNCLSVEPTYADLQFNEGNQDFATGISSLLQDLNSRENYVHIISNTSKDPEPQTNKYVNVDIDRARYVNASGEVDYAEPAYCEVNVNKF